MANVVLVESGKAGKDVTGDLQKPIKDLSPAETWDALSNNKNTALVDVRTAAEWGFVGIPELGATGKDPLLVEWRRAPDMSVNPEFANTLLGALGEDVPEQLFFLCRSGARSREAGQYIQNILSGNGISCECVNVAEGFEGDLNPQGHRGKSNGWKARELPWKQS